MNPPRSSADQVNTPSPQEAYKRAIQLGFDTLAGQSQKQIEWLGAERLDDGWQLTVLAQRLRVCPKERRVVTSAEEEVSPAWGILALHYLAVTTRPAQQEPAITFADLGASRSYAGVYQGRVIHRLCATAGRNAQTLTAAAESLGAQTVNGGDLAFDFPMFPRVTLRLIWHAADDEFPPSATILLPSNIEEFFCAEDIVVLSESLVARLCGKPF